MCVCVCVILPGAHAGMVALLNSSGDIRTCVERISHNIESVKRQAYPMPTLDEILDQR
jgi:hypothetical protein